jgi:fibronectin-binding autotransporter adhesin
VAGNLTLDSAYESVFDLTNSTAVGGGTNDLVVVTGDLDAGLGTIRINPLAPLVSGTYRLMEYAGTEPLPFSGGLVGLNTRDTAVLDETTPGQVNLIVTAGAAQALAWNPAVDGNWDYGTQNWLDAATRSATEQFYDLDTVLFDDAGAFNNVVNVTTNLRPAAIYVTGGSNYTFVGNGRIQDQQGGATALGKDGPGELTLGTTNSFSGGIVVSNGLLVAGVSGALGGGPVALLGGQLALAAPMTVTNTVALQAPTVVVDDRGNAVTLSALVSGPGQLIKSGGGTLTLGVANTYTGGTVISAGMVRQAVPGALGTAPGSIILGDASSGTNMVAWRFAAATQPSNAITVTVLGTGPASLGSYNNSTFTEHRGPIALARAVTLVDGTTDRTSFTGPITGAPGLITISGTRITLDNPSNTFVAGLLVSGGSIYQNNNTSALPFTTTITNNGAFRLNNGGRHVVDALGGTGTVDIVAGGVSTLSLGNANGSDVFAGRIVNGAAALSLEKKGVGVQTLSNTNSYTGNTTILGGTLALSGLATLAGTPQILVGAAGHLRRLGAARLHAGGQPDSVRRRGTVTGEVVTAAGAQIRPDGFNSVNTLTFKNTLGLHAGSTNWFDLTGTLGVGGGTNDLVVVDGLLEPSNSVIQVNVLQPLASGTYTLFTYTGAKTTTFNPAPILSLSPGRKTATAGRDHAGPGEPVVSGAMATWSGCPRPTRNWNFVRQQLVEPGHRGAGHLLPE